MRRILIAAVLILFSVTAHAQAPAPPAERGDGWRTVAVGVGALAGIWAVNAATAGFAAGSIMTSLGQGNVVAAVSTLAKPPHTVLILAGAISGGYIAAWLYD